MPTEEMRLVCLDIYTEGLFAEIRLTSANSVEKSHLRIRQARMHMPL